MFKGLLRVRRAIYFSPNAAGFKCKLENDKVKKTSSELLSSILLFFWWFLNLSLFVIEQAQSAASVAPAARAAPTTPRGHP